MREIARVVDDIIASYADPELEPFARHERAWYRSDGAEQTRPIGIGYGRLQGDGWKGAEAHQLNIRAV